MILVWFRRDLRTLDHTLKAARFWAACCCFCCNARAMARASHGNAADLIARRLTHLEEELAGLNIPLLYKEVPKFSDVTRSLRGGHYH